MCVVLSCCRFSFPLAFPCVRLSLSSYTIGSIFRSDSAGLLCIYTWFSSSFNSFSKILLSFFLSFFRLRSTHNVKYNSSRYFSPFLSFFTQRQKFTLFFFFFYESIHLCIVLLLLFVFLFFFYSDSSTASHLFFFFFVSSSPSNSL